MFPLFPVFEDKNNQRNHQILDIKLVKQLKGEVMAYGVQAAYTISLLENVASQNLTLTDWDNLAKACLPGGQYLM